MIHGAHKHAWHVHTGTTHTHTHRDDRKRVTAEMQARTVEFGREDEAGVENGRDGQEEERVVVNQP